MYWTVALEGGPKRVNHAAVTVGDKIYSFGGYCNGVNTGAIHNIDVYILYTATLRWKICEFTGKADEIPFQRYGHTVVAYKNKIYLWGGRNESEACNTLYCFDPGTRSWSAPSVSGNIPVARDGHSACVIDNTMYVFAGYLDIPGIYTQEICSLNLETFVWNYISTKEPKPIYRDFHTAVTFNGLMYVWGGREVPSGWHENDGDGEYGSQMYVFDPVAKEWSLIEAYGDIPIGRRSHSAVAFKGKMLVFGGFNSKEQYKHFNDLYLFNPETRFWKKLNSPGCAPKPRRRQAFCLCGTKIYLFGGTSPDPNQSQTSQENVQDAEWHLDDRRLIDHSDLYVLDLEPTLKTLAILKVLEHGLDIYILPRDILEVIRIMTTPNQVFRPQNPSG